MAKAVVKFWQFHQYNVLQPNAIKHTFYQQNQDIIYRSIFVRKRMPKYIACKKCKFHLIKNRCFYLYRLIYMTVCIRSPEIRNILNNCVILLSHLSFIDYACRKHVAFEKISICFMGIDGSSFLLIQLYDCVNPKRKKYKFQTNLKYYFPI